MSTIVRPLEFKDAKQIEYVDNNGEFKILPFILDILEESDEETTVQDYAYGIFLDDKLIGYCTIGGADVIETSEYEDELLGDVMILDEYQGNGYGTKLIEYVLKEHNDHTVYADLLDDGLINFYARFGFKNAYDEEIGLIKLER